VLSVIKTTTTAEPVSNQWEVPEVYLSQALGWIIGKILPRDAKAAAEPQEYAWYYYVASSMKPKVYQRMDKWERTSDGSFMLTTYLSPETPPYTSTYDKDGNLIRRVHGDGSVTEPIELEELRKIWKAKGLPVSANQP
jgi:YD repeat-containing protein